MSIYKFILILILIINIFSCAEKTTYYGKIINDEDLNFDILNKKELLSKFGKPSYVDALLNKYFYFTEKSRKKNFFNNKIDYSYLFVFEFDESDNIIDTETVNLLLEKNHKYKKEQTESSIIKRGILEKVFGGIGPEQLPNSP